MIGSFFTWVVAILLMLGGFTMVNQIQDAFGVAGLVVVIIVVGVFVAIISSYVWRDT